MLELTHGEASEYIIVTLEEKKTLPEPYFLFIFTHGLTNATVAKIFSPSDDLSDYPSRYNKFEVATAALFANQPPGEWLYEAYEQESAVNTDPDAATSLLENGKMKLAPAAANEFAYETYDETTTYKAYNG